jgi:hypothetical protein
MGCRARRPQRPRKPDQIRDHRREKEATMRSLIPIVLLVTALAASSATGQCVPPGITTQPHPHAICPGGTISLEVIATGSPPLGYQWFHDGAALPGKTGSVLRINGTASSEGRYHVVVRNQCGRVVSAPAPIVIPTAASRSWDSMSVGMNGPVLALQAFDDGMGSALYAGGGFTMAGGVPASRVARWIGSAWQPVGDGFNAPVRALGVFDLGGGPALYAAGEFTMSGSVPIDRVAKWNGSVWTPVGAGIPNGVVRALHLFDSGSGPRLHAGGTFTLAGSDGGLAFFDGGVWSLAGGGGVGSVHALEAFADPAGPMLYVGGSFTLVGSPIPYTVARWDGAYWMPLRDGDPPDLVRTLFRYDDGAGAALYVGGDFQGWNGLNGIARFDGVAWSPLGAGLGTGGVHALAEFDDGSGPALFAGGNFTASGTALVNRIARWRSGAWSELGMGRDDLVSAIAVHAESGCADLYTGGWFFHAGGVLVNFVARWKPALTLELSQPLGAGSLAIVNAFGDPFAHYFSAFSFDPANATAPGAGPWFGLFIPPDQLLGQFAFGAPPFVGTLDQIGQSIFTFPAGALSDLTAVRGWGLTLTYDPVLVSLIATSNLATITLH